MLEYINSYCVPGPGYRGPMDVEAALEKHYRESIVRTLASLERHTGLTHSTKIECWPKWAEERKHKREQPLTQRDTLLVLIKRGLDCNRHKQMNTRLQSDYNNKTNH